MIFQHESYKTFLRQWISSQPGNGRGHVGKLAEHLNISGSLVSAILNGDRQISVEQACEISDYLHLKPLESDYLVALVSSERAGSQKLKKYWEKQKKIILNQSEKIENRIEFEKVLTDEQKSQYYSNAIYSQIRILTTLDAGASLADLTSMIKLSNLKIKNAVSLLVEFGLIFQKDNRYFASEKAVHLLKESPYYLQHHKNWRLQQLNQVTETNETDLTYTSPCTLDEETFKKIKKLLLQGIKETHELIRKSPADQLACLTIDFISYKTND